ncbi:hypothetical protein BD311DRAFT_752844 [Dichomitus squalens]|uniref:Uncharacterized protein n=1 Tax=Dichomitus squalens TaxID=114155 RepID=A0A4Q9MXA9_9APHY|nr:hypothetical protein BD311DRAFT_752844 [Dichomitus squalens]
MIGELWTYLNRFNCSITFCKGCALILSAIAVGHSLMVSSCICLAQHRRVGALTDVKTRRMAAGVTLAQMEQYSIDTYA